MKGYGFNYPRNGGHRTKMRGDVRAALSVHPDPVCRTCPICLLDGSCKDHPGDRERLSAAFDEVCDELDRERE